MVPHADPATAGGPALASLTRVLPGAARLPYVRLGVWPTPVERIEAVSAASRSDVWVKRDDVCAQAYGGNKVRKLEFLLGKALAEGRRSVVTFGAVGSNHVLATAVHGARVGLGVHVVLSPQARTAGLPVSLLADLGAGAVLHAVGSFEESSAEGERVARELADSEGVEPLVIPFGGTSAVGTIGFVAAALEMAAQADRGDMMVPDVVYVPFGSMGTAVGLAVGFALARLKTRVVGVRVVPEDMAGPERAAEAAADVLAALSAADPRAEAVVPSDLALEVRGGYLGQGYALPTRAGTAAIEAATADGLRLEGTYTGKALAALLDDGAAGRLQGLNVVFWDTYNSRPLPRPGRRELLPEALQGYVTDR